MDEIKQKSTSKTTGTGTRTEMNWQLVKQKKKRTQGTGTKVSWLDTRTNLENGKDPNDENKEWCVSRAFSQNNPV
jgi:hypothetical protein